MTETELTIKAITDRGLCSGCGACMGICPKKAISMERNGSGFLYADIDGEFCVKCGQCIKVCPSMNPTERTESAMVGSILKAYALYACDEEIRRNGQSGGVVTALLLYLLEKGEIEEAIVTDYTDKEGQSVAKSAKIREELIHAQGSSYMQNETLVKFLQADTIAVPVLLGCQARALHNIECVIPNKISSSTVKIGLFCGGCNSPEYIKEVRKGVKGKGKKYTFRARDKRYGGAPGDAILQEGSQVKVISRKKRIRAFQIWMNYKCSICTEFYNPYCDIVCGDPWGITSKDVTDKGITVCLVRTKEGEKLVERALQEHVVDGWEISGDDVIKGQGMLEKLLKPEMSKRESDLLKLYFSGDEARTKILRRMRHQYDYYALKISFKSGIKKLLKRIGI